MAYLGRPGATAPLTSADIPDNSITGAKIVAGTIEASDVAADMATQAELDLKAPLASPAFTGTPTGITGSHITSGTLGNTVQDNITRLGTVTAGNLSNTAIVYPAGHVLQIVWNHYSTQLTKTTTAYEDLGLNATITPKTTSNKILIQWIVQAKLATTQSGYGTKLLHNASGSYDTSPYESTAYAVYTDVASNQLRLYTTWQYLDTPGVTSAVNYKIQVSNYNTPEVQYCSGSNRSYIQLTEIVA